jgi:hypothetical protein
VEETRTNDLMAAEGNKVEGGNLNFFLLAMEVVVVGTNEGGG